MSRPVDMARAIVLRKLLALGPLSALEMVTYTGWQETDVRSALAVGLAEKWIHRNSRPWLLRATFSAINPELAFPNSTEGLPA